MSLIFYQKYHLCNILVVSLILLWTHFMLLMSKNENLKTGRAFVLIEFHISTERNIIY